jgi:elongation factor P
MAMVDQFSKGMFLLVDDQLNVVVDRRYKTQGRQGGLIILDFKNIETGLTSNKTVKAGTKFEQVIPEYREMQYLYMDGESAYFMDTESYENETIKNDLIGSYSQFLKEGDKYVVMFHEGSAISLRENNTVELKVTEAMDAVKGNTANSATKIVTTETGYKVNAPMFVKVDDIITVNTETGEYMGRKS